MKVFMGYRDKMLTPIEIVPRMHYIPQNWCECGSKERDASPVRNLTPAVQPNFSHQAVSIFTNSFG
jgi:hypothetical protein